MTNYYVTHLVKLTKDNILTNYLLNSYQTEHDIEKVPDFKCLLSDSVPKQTRVQHGRQHALFTMSLSCLAHTSESDSSALFSVKVSGTF